VGRRTSEPVKLALHPVQARMRAPFVSGTGSVTARELVQVTLTGADGVSGHGEAAPLESYDGGGTDAVIAAIEHCRGTRGGAEGLEIPHLLAECGRRAVLPQALAAIDLALWDLAGRRAGQPVWRLLGAQRADPVAVNWTIAAPDRAGAATEAARARADGYG